MACMNAEKKKLRPKEQQIIILDDLHQSWTEKEMKEAAFMYKNGCSLEMMAKKLRPYDKLSNATDEVALLIIHLGRQGRIKPKGGSYEPTSMEPK